MKNFRYAIPLIITYIDLYIKKHFRNKFDLYKTFKSLKLLSIHPVKNKGIGLNLLDNELFRPYIKYIIAIVLIILIYEWLKMKNKAQQTAWSFIIGGGLSNLIDRCKHGYVLDYLSIDFYKSIFNHSKLFKKAIVCNFADLSVFIGFLYIIYQMIPKFITDLEKKIK